MKRVLIYILFTLPFFGFSQSKTHNFEIEGSEFIWRRVFNTELSFNDLLREIRQRGDISIDVVNEENKTIQGSFSEIRPDVKGAGLKDMTTPMYASRVSCFGNVDISYREGRYRVTISRIKIAFMNSVEMLRNQNSYEWLAYYGVVDNRLDRKFLKRGAIAYNYTFIRMFNFPTKTISKEVDNW